MTDKYVQKQVVEIARTNDKDVQNDALYRLGTYLEVIEPDGNAEKAREHWSEILNKAKEVLGGDE